MNANINTCSAIYYSYAMQWITILEWLQAVRNNFPIVITHLENQCCTLYKCSIIGHRKNIKPNYSWNNSILLCPQKHFVHNMLVQALWKQSNNRVCYITQKMQQWNVSHKALDTATVVKQFLNFLACNDTTDFMLNAMSDEVRKPNFYVICTATKFST